MKLNKVERYVDSMRMCIESYKKSPIRALVEINDRAMKQIMFESIITSHSYLKEYEVLFNFIANYGRKYNLKTVNDVIVFIELCKDQLDKIDSLTRLLEGTCIVAEIFNVYFEKCCKLYNDLRHYPGSTCYGKSVDVNIVDTEWQYFLNVLVTRMEYHLKYECIAKTGLSRKNYRSALWTTLKDIKSRTKHIIRIYEKMKYDRDHTTEDNEWIKELFTLRDLEITVAPSTISWDMSADKPSNVVIKNEGEE